MEDDEIAFLPTVEIYVFRLVHLFEKFVHCVTDLLQIAHHGDFACRRVGRVEVVYACAEDLEMRLAVVRILPHHLVLLVYCRIYLNTRRGEMSNSQETCAPYPSSTPAARPTSSLSPP